MKRLMATTGLSLVLLFQNCSRVNFSDMPSVVAPMCVDLTAPDVQPKLKWDWYTRLDLSDAANFPEYKQVMSTPMVGDLNGDKFPEVVFVTFKSGLYTGAGVLRIVDGRTGETIRSVGADRLAPFGSTAPLLIDIDADGRTEIVYAHANGESVVALNFDGSERWVLPLGLATTVNRASFAAADFNRDGKAEVIVGHAVISETPDRQPFVLFWLPAEMRSGLSFATSLDAARPTSLQIIGSSGVYDGGGNRLFGVKEAFYAAGNIDTDAAIELVGVRSGGGDTELLIYNGVNGDLKAAVDLGMYNDLRCPKGIGGGFPTLGDFDGNPDDVEIAMATGRYLIIMSAGGELLARYPTQDCSSLVTGITSFDFNGDGTPEILYGDEEYFRIFEMHQGQLRVIASIVNPSGTLYEYPVVADIDGNGSSEILIASNNYAATGFYKDPGEEADAVSAAAITGVRAFESEKENAWMKTRAIWNTYHYNPALVTDQLRAVSRGPAPNNFMSRFFRRNTQMTQYEAHCSHH